MNEPRESRLSAFRKDLDRLAREAEALTESLGADSRLAREEAVGAEILATRDLMTHLGIVWDTVEQLGDLAGRQARLFVEDYLTTMSILLDGTAREQGAVLGAHVERRLTHIAQGLDQSIEVLSTQSQKACDSLFRIWSPFFSVVRQDWTRQRGTGEA